jgi:hypothetical protein
MNVTRDGVYPDTLLDRTYAASLKLNQIFTPTGAVYAQPLYVTNGPGGKEAIIVATESNHLAAIDASGTAFWDQPFGTAVPGGNLPCGNINPLGITGTPVIDPTSRTIYFDAMTSVGGAPTHVIHAVSLDSGAEQTGWPAGGVNVDMYVTGFTSRTQNQRGALTLLNDVLYVPYGGLDGDCGTYFGYVMGFPVHNPTAVTVFSVGAMFPTGSAAATGATRGGIWAVGGVAASPDGTSMFVSTGNTSGNATVWSGGEAVLRLAAGPTFTNSAANQFYPTEWAQLDSSDADLGGANPVVVDMPGTATPHLVVAFGKDGYVYILNRDNLGGMGGNLSRTAVAPQGTGGRGSLSAASAAYTTSQGTYVAYRLNQGPGTGCPSGGASQGSIGVAKISGNPPTAKVAWCTTETGMGSPMVTKTPSGQVIVWDANSRLYGYDGDTGDKIFAGGGASDAMANAMHYYNSAIDIGGRIVVAAGRPGQVYLFKP